MNETDKLYMDYCSYAAAKYAVEHWHYSKCMPVGKLVKVGVWENNKYIGVVIFGMGNNLHIGYFLDLSLFEICELVRIALNKHLSPVSRIIKIAIIKLKEVCPGLKAIISYADPEQKHIGKIYQASNWYYVGESTRTRIMVLHGKRIHSRTAFPGGRQFGRRVKKIKGIEKANIILSQPKLKYVKPLNKDVKIKLEKFQKEYPQICPGGVIVARPSIQKESGSSNLTSGLSIGVKNA